MNQPNVVFIIADQHRWDFMGGESNGTTHTPNLDRIAASGTRIRTATCTAPLCSPSRAAIASGRYGMNTGCFTNLHELPPDTPTFVSQFRGSGYRTAVVGKTHMGIHAYDADYTSEAHRAFMHSLGWDDTCEISGNGMLRQGLKCHYSEYLRTENRFDDVLKYYENWHYFMDKERGGDPGFVPHEWPLEDEYQETTFVGSRALRWLETRDRARPYFLHVGFAGPHSPIEPSTTHMDLYRNAPETPPWNNEAPPEWLADGRRGYRAMISQIDEWVGHIYDRIAADGELDNTVFVYTADHGEMAGDHGRFDKTCFYEASLRVPLVMSGPGIREGCDSGALVEIIDLGKTLCDLCGVPPHALDLGRSLVPVLAGVETGHRDTLYAEMGCDRMLRSERYKLMWGDPKSDKRKLGRLHLDKPVNIPPSPARLYDIEADPTECVDLAQDPSHRTLLSEMVQKLLARINQNTQARPNKSRGEYTPLRSD